MAKNDKKLTINDLPKQVPDFKNSDLPKDRLTEKWLTEWIIASLKHNLIKIGDILPKKSDIANYLQIGTGTVQNAVRYIEDKGILQSKQKTGTLITGSLGYTKYRPTDKKQNSKRDITIAKIKKFIIENGINSVMPPAKDLAKKINVSANTVRLAYLHLCDNGFLEYSSIKSGKKILKIKTLPEKPSEHSSSHLSLVEKTVSDLSDYISENMKKGEKLKTRDELAKILKISIKTVHDAISVLEERGILVSRRGKYGTIVVKLPQDAQNYNPVNERSIFAKADEAAFYRWEKIETLIINIIKSDFQAGMKIPSMNFFAKKFNVSTNTVRKALQILSDKGYIYFERGRYGGTFVNEIPEQHNQNTYEWVAITQNFAPLKAGN